jgi:succinate dehydrogenase/fumarate reductase flavoprotein subunit
VVDLPTKSPRAESPDVVVIGSGASGAVAALTAAAAGLRTTVLEKAGSFGGTSALSGGGVWVPANRFMGPLGISDSRDDALMYLRALTLGRVDDALLVQFVDSVNPMVDLLKRHTGIAFTPTARHSDYQPHLPGARPGGRTLTQGLYDLTRLGELADGLRASHTALPVTRAEVEAWGEDMLDNWDWVLIAQRMEQHVVGMGAALMGELLEACTRLGVVFRNHTRALELCRTPRRVTGVRAETPEGPLSISAEVGVVLASGGYEWNAAYVDRFLGVPMVAPGSPPTNDGDGLRMAMQVGATLGNMNEAWWAPMVTTGDTYDEQPLHRATSGVRALPGGVVVNRAGRRFANEAMNYNDFVKAMIQFDPGTYSYANLPCWLIFDAEFRRSYAVATLTPDAPTPAWLAQAETLEALAERLGIDGHGLDEALAEFNAHARLGRDPVFHRGENSYDQYRGDPRVYPNRTLRPLGEGPYFGVELRLGCIGTKGGPVIDVHGRVVGADEHAIPGLYACGNVAAGVFGPGYPGAGATLSAGMTFGYIIGQHLARAAGQRAVDRHTALT